MASCPLESDVNETVIPYLKGETDAIAGYMAIGTEGVADVLKKAIKDMFPDGNLIVLDRDNTCSLNFPRELAEYLSDLIKEGRNDIVVAEDIQIIGWRTAIDGFCNEHEIHVHCITRGCRLAPTCMRII